MKLKLLSYIALAGMMSVVSMAQEGRQAPLPPNPLKYDLILQGGHVFDAKNNLDGIRDVGIKDGKIANVSDHLNS